MIDSLQPAGAETTGKTKFKLLFGRLLIHDSAIKAAPIHIGDSRHVGGVLETSLDLEAADPDPHQLRDQRPGRQILG